MRMFRRHGRLSPVPGLGAGSRLCPSRREGERGFGEREREKRERKREREREREMLEREIERERERERGILVR